MTKILLPWAVRFARSRYDSRLERAMFIAGAVVAICLMAIRRVLLLLTCEV